MRTGKIEEAGSTGQEMLVEVEAWGVLFSCVDSGSSGSLWRIIGSTCYTILKVVWGIKKGVC